MKLHLNILRCCNLPSQPISHCRLPFYVELVLLGYCIIGWSCSWIPRVAFPPGLEVSARADSVLDSSHPNSSVFRAVIKSPEQFKGANLQGALQKTDRGRALVFTRMIQAERPVCVHGDLVSVTNSAGVVGRYDTGFTLRTEILTA